MPTTYRTSSGRLRWRANWRDAEAHQHSKNFDDEGEALAYERRMVAEREMSLPEQECAREGCTEIVVQNMVDGVLQGKRRRYHSAECERLVRNESAARRKREERLPAELPLPTPCGNPECNEMVEQTGVGRRKRFHTVECGRSYWNKQKSRDREPKRPLHSLTNIDEAARTATCSNADCQDRNPVPIYRSEDVYQDGRKRVRWNCKYRVQGSSAESRARYKATEKHKAMRMRSRHGLTREQQEAAMASKTDHCDICECPEDEVGELVYEHDHDSGTHRGWTCHDCNLGIGKLRHDPAVLRRAADYLEAHT